MAEKNKMAEDEKIKELRVELLKAGSKRQRIKRQIARLLTLQNNKMKTEKTVQNKGEKK